MKKYEEHVNELMWNHKLKVQLNIHDSEKPYGENTVLKIEVEQDTAEKISNLLNKDTVNNGKYKVSWKSLEDTTNHSKTDWSKML